MTAKADRARQRLWRCAWTAATVVLCGCAWDAPQTTVIARSDLTRTINSVYALVTWATIVIAVVVLGVLAVILVRFRDRPGAPLPPQTRGHALLEIAWTIAPALVLLVIAIPTIQVIFRTQGAADPKALEITVVGQQWWWEFKYPALGVVTANEPHVPAGRPVILRLHGADVIHSLWVPQLLAKRDVIPGRVNQISFTADQPGEYWGQCAEFCGIAHALMALRMIVVTPEEFDRWTARQRAMAAEPAADAAEGKAIYTANACVGCHTINGVSAGVLGPSLTSFGERRTLGAGILPNTPDNLTAWIRNPSALKPGVKMPALGLSEEQARAVATYLLTLR